LVRGCGSSSEAKAISVVTAMPNASQAPRVIYLMPRPSDVWEIVLTALGAKRLPEVLRALGFTVVETDWMCTHGLLDISSPELGAEISLAVQDPLAMQGHDDLARWDRPRAIAGARALDSVQCDALGFLLRSAIDVACGFDDFMLFPRTEPMGEVVHDCSPLQSRVQRETWLCEASRAHMARLTAFMRVRGSPILSSEPAGTGSQDGTPRSVWVYRLGGVGWRGRAFLLVVRDPEATLCGKCAFAMFGATEHTALSRVDARAADAVSQGLASRRSDRETARRTVESEWRRICDSWVNRNSGNE
jgi:hypothetical protein